MVFGILRDGIGWYRIVLDDWMMVSKGMGWLGYGPGMVWGWDRIVWGWYGMSRYGIVWDGLGWYGMVCDGMEGM
jgi:hypothetical protein